MWRWTRIVAVVAVLVAANACTDDGSAEGAAGEPWGRTFLADGPPPVRVTFGDADRQAVDAELGALLRSSPTIEIDGATLTLTGTDRSLELTDHAAVEPDLPLRGTRWLVDGMVRGDEVSALPAGIEPPYLELGETRFEGYDGCNWLYADIAYEEDLFEVAEVAVTLMDCDVAGLPTIELAPVLNGTVAYEIEGASLRLTGAEGRGVTLHAASS